MKIVWASPPNLVYDQTPHYFQALFSAGAVYLRSRFPEAEVVTEAAGFHGAVERVILRHFACHQPADYLVLWARPWEAHAARRVAQEVAELSPVRISLSISKESLSIFTPSPETRSGSLRTLWKPMKPVNLHVMVVAMY